MNPQDQRDRLDLWSVLGFLLYLATIAFVWLITPD